MSVQFLLTAYLSGAMAQAEYDKLEDNTFAGRIPSCPGVVAFSATLQGCAEELRSVLEEWLWLGLKLGHRLPVIDGIDLNREPAHESLEAV
jgi:predicted RNase H-like HicB family nuclease